MDTTETAVEELLRILGGMFPKDFSTSEVVIWHQILSNYSPKEIRGALTETLKRSGNFCPQPGLIAKIIDEQSATSDLSSLAWADAKEGIEAAGNSNNIEYQDKIIHCVIARMGGWVNFCQDTDEKWVEGKRKVFMRNYEEFLKHGIRDKPPEVLRGSVDIGFTKRLKCSYIKLIKEPEKHQIYLQKSDTKKLEAGRKQLQEKN